MWTALLTAVVCNNIIGMLWYSPLLFLKTMIETTHLDPTGANMSLGIVLATNVLALMECFGMYYALSILRVSTVAEGVKYGFLLWQFFIFPTFSVHYLYDRRPVKHLAMYAGHHLVNMIVQGAVIAMLK